jgi:hypothetical protein
MMQVLHVLGTRGDTKVAAPIVEVIPVDVVHLYIAVNPSDEAMHIDR